MIEFEIEGDVLYNCNDGFNQHNAEIVIPDGIRVIKRDALKFCYTVRLVIPKSVEVIEDGAFYFIRVDEVENNSSIELPTDQKTLSNMFGMPPLSVCKSGESRLVTDSEGFVFLSSEQPILVDYVGSGGDITLPEHFDARKYEIGHYAFKHISSITAVTVPSTVSVIGAGAFENCEELTAVTLLGAEVIGFAAFSECPSLCKISLNDGLREIGECAFQFCEKIVELDIPRSVTLIGRSALQYCESLERLSIPVCDIGDDRVDPREYYFGKLFGARDRIIQSVDSRPPRCLKELTLYGDIPDWSFVTAYGLRELTLVGARRIGDHAFYDLPRLERVVLPEGLAVIGYRAFAKCTSLEFLTLPEDVEIHKDAFVDCPLLTL